MNRRQFMKVAPTVAALSSSLAVAEAAAEPTLVKKEVEKFQGSWNVLSASVNGASIPWFDLQDEKATIKGQDLTFNTFFQSKSTSTFFRVGGVTKDSPTRRPVLKTIVSFKIEYETKATPIFYQLDPSTTPKRIDCRLQDNHFPGIYSLDGEQLKICLAFPGVDRPKDLAAAPKRFVLVLGRKRPNDKEARSKSQQREHEQLTGTWTVASGRYDLEKLSEKDLEGFRLTFGDDGLKWEEAGTKEMLTVQLDPVATPAAINLTVAAGPNKGKILRGIYQVEKDRLTLRLPPTFSDERPKDLKQEEGVEAVLILKRAKP
jgi:uncharacterized protein (TIGR03067 family)